jgi:hypothetical protein
MPEFRIEFCPLCHWRFVWPTVVDAVGASMAEHYHCPLCKRHFFIENSPILVQHCPTVEDFNFSRKGINFKLRLQKFKESFVKELKSQLKKK